MGSRLRDLGSLARDSKIGDRCRCRCRNRGRGIPLAGTSSSRGPVGELDEDLQALARACLLLSALAVSLHYHRDRLAAGLGRDRPYRRHRQPQFVPEPAAASAERGPVAAAAAVLPGQDRQSVEGDAVGVTAIPPRSLRDRRRRARQSLQRDDDRPRRQRRQLLQHRPDARVRPDVVQGSGAEHDDDSPGRVGVRTDLQVPCEAPRSI